MKTTADYKKELVNYLTKTSKHLYQTESGHYFVTILQDNTLVVLDSNGGVRKYNIDSFVEYYKEHSKSIMKQSLFLGKKTKTVRRYKALREKIESFKSENLDLRNVSEEKLKTNTIFKTT